MSLIKNSSIYLISNITNAAIPFFLLPILTRYLTVEEYGQIAIFQMLLSALSTLIGLNSLGSAERKYYDKNINKSSLRHFNGSCIQIMIFSSLLCVILTVLFGEVLSHFLSIPISWIYLSILISSLSYVILLRLGQWQIRGNAISFGILQVSNSITNMILSLLLVISLKQGVAGRIDAQLISALILALVSLFLLYKNKLIILLTYQKKYILEALYFGIPLIPHSIGFFFLNVIDRYFINKELGLAQAGIYMVAVQLSSVLSILFDAINKAYIPWLFDVLSKNNYFYKKKIVRYTYLYFLLLIFLSIIPFIIGPVAITLIAGEKYIESGYIIGWLCLGQIFGGMYLMVTNYIFYSKKTGRLAIITISTGLVNIFLLLTLLHNFGLIGAAYAFAISKLIQFLLTWLLASKLVEMPWLNRRQQ